MFTLKSKKSILMLIAIILASCSIHIGNPKDFEGEETKKAEPELSIVFNGSNFEQSENLKIQLSKIALSSDNNQKYFSIEKQDGFNMSFSNANAWADYLIRREKVQNGTYSKLELTFISNTIGTFSVLDTSYPVFVDKEYTYTIPIDIDIDFGRITTLNVSFAKADSLEAVTVDSVIKGYTLKNTFKADSIEIQDNEPVEVQTEDGVKHTIETGRIIHFDSSKIGSLFTDEACSIPAATDGDPIVCWKEVTGRIPPVIQDNEDRQPIYRGSGIGFMPSVEFDGQDDQFHSSVENILFTAHSIVFVGNFFDIAREQSFFSFGAGFSNRGTAAGTSPTGDLTYSFAVRNNIYYSPMPQNRPVVLVFTYSGGDTAGPARQAYLNGAMQISSAKEENEGVLNLPRESGLNIGNLIPIGDFRFTGQFSELMLYNRELSSDEIQEITELMIAKYGIDTSP